MGKNYEELSRRGLIKLDHDYDHYSGGDLAKYLAKHEGEYENIRPVEKVVDCYDNVMSAVNRTISCVKESYRNDGSTKCAVKVLNAIADNGDVIRGGIKAFCSVTDMKFKK